MTKQELIQAAKEIREKCPFHYINDEGARIAMHKSAIKRLRKEKSILMMNGEWAKNGRG